MGEGKWINKQRVLVFCSRGLGARERHLMEDLRQMMPHSKTESKLDTKDDLKIINEVAEVRNCNKLIYFDCRKHQDLYMWVSDVINGPSVKFHVVNVHTMLELKLSGNCLKGSRPILKFDKSFDEPYWAVIRELFVQVFGTPHQHPRSQPFIDHVLTFTVLDGKIWLRNYQILEEDGELAEIGPRAVFNPIKILEGSFRGATLWENPKFKTPPSIRSYRKMLADDKFHTKQRRKEEQKRDKNKVKSMASHDLLSHLG